MSTEERAKCFLQGMQLVASLSTAEAWFRARALSPHFASKEVLLQILDEARSFLQTDCVQDKSYDSLRDDVGSARVAVSYDRIESAQEFVYKALSQVTRPTRPLLKPPYHFQGRFTELES